MGEQIPLFHRLHRGLRVTFDNGFREGVVVKVEGDRVQVKWYHPSESQPQLWWVDRTAVTPAARNGR